MSSAAVVIYLQMATSIEFQGLIFEFKTMKYT